MRTKSSDFWFQFFGVGVALFILTGIEFAVSATVLSFLDFSWTKSMLFTVCLICAFVNLVVSFFISGVIDPIKGKLNKNETSDMKENNDDDSDLWK